MDLTIVAFVHNLSIRGTDRLRNTYYSLRSQPEYPKIILVNSSNDDSFQRLDDYCKEFNVTHLYRLHEESTWNKSRGLNAGLKLVKTAFTMFTDADYIFAPNFLETVNKNLDPKKLLIRRTHDSPSVVDFTTFNMSSYFDVLKVCKLHKACGEGAAQIAETSWFRKIGGYDERLVLHGGMDNDIVRRAKRDGLKVRWMEGTYIIHQWHKRKKQQKQLHANRRLFAVTKSVQRNNGVYGEMDFSIINDYGACLST